jgi:hypothetical protein
MKKLKDLGIVLLTAIVVPVYLLTAGIYHVLRGNPVAMEFEIGDGDEC